MDFGMIAPGELQQYAKDDNAFIIDLRTPEEYRTRHIPGAVNIPYKKLDGCRRFPKDMTLILYCERGAVSMVAAKELAAKGYRVKTLIGGIHGYQAALE